MHLTDIEAAQSHPNPGAPAGLYSLVANLSVVCALSYSSLKAEKQREKTHFLMSTFQQHTKKNIIPTPQKKSQAISIRLRCG